MSGLPSVRHVRQGRHAIHGVAIERSDGSTAYCIPFAKSGGIQGIAISDSLVLVADVCSGKERDLALIDVATGKVTKRARVSNGSLALDKERKLIVLFRSHPFIETIDAHSLQTVARFDRLTAENGKFEAKPAYTPDELAAVRAINEAKRLAEASKPGAQAHSAFSVIAFAGYAYEEPDGWFFACLKEDRRESNQNVMTFYPVRVSIKTGEIETLAAFPITYTGAAHLNSPRPDIRPDGSASVAYHKGEPTPLVPRRIERPLPVPELCNRELSPFGDEDPKFGRFVEARARTRIEVGDWTAQSCDAALQRLAQAMAKRSGSFVWGERLEFTFIVGGQSVKEGDFFDRIVADDIRCEDAVRAFVLSYLAKAKYLARNFGYSLRTHDDIPPFGPAMKALIWLSPTDLPLLQRFMQLQDVAHNSYLGLCLLPAFVSRHGWPTLEHMSMGLGYLLDSDARAPKEMPDLDLFKHAAPRMSADDFADFILHHDAVRKEVSAGQSDGLLESFFSRFDKYEQFTSEVIASLEKRLKRRVTWS